MQELFERLLLAIAEFKPEDLHKVMGILYEIQQLDSKMHTEALLEDSSLAGLGKVLGQTTTVSDLYTASIEVLTQLIQSK